MKGCAFSEDMKGIYSDCLESLYIRISVLKDTALCWHYSYAA